MRKVFSIFLAVLFFSLSFFIYATESFASTQIVDIEKTQLGTTDTYYEFDSATGTLTITGEGKTPSYTSNGMGAPWYDWRSDSINKVIVDEGVTTLGDYFLYQVKATSIDLPESLVKIGSSALSYTLGITSWDFAYGLTTIGSSAFYYCYTLESITLPDSLTSIGMKAFQGCSALKSITIPYSVTSIGSNAFNQCTALSEVNFESLTSSVAIGSSCFLGCSELKSLTVPVNATMKSYSYGYKTSSTKYSDVSMNVYDDTNAMLYAVSSSIPYTTYDEIPVKTAVGYSNIYNDDNVSDSYIYSFTPQNSEKYNIYTRGNCDVKCSVADGDNVIAENDDISDTDRNSFVSVSLTAGKTYLITLSSVKSSGTYTLWIYPDSIKSFNVKGSAVCSATANMTKTDDNNLTSLLLTIQFNDGLVDKMYYNADFFDGIYMAQYETELNCGENTAYISLGDITAPYSLYVNHNYESKDVKYTVDDDGYTLYYCVLCDDDYKTDYVATPSIKITGTAVFAEDKSGSHDNNVPYTFGEIVIYDVGTYQERTYEINSDGTWQINTFNNVDVYLVNDEGKRFCFSYLVDDLEPYSVVDYGALSVFAYDFNNDSRVNAKDYAIFIREKRDKYGADYWQFAKNFMP